jgi:hypothetical protein
MPKIMEFRYVPPNELNVAKRKVVKKMRRNAKNEPNYAMTTVDLSSYTEYYNALVELNDNLYNLVVNFETLEGIPIKGLYAKIVSLLSRTKKMDMSTLSSVQKADVREQLDEFVQRQEELAEDAVEGFRQKGKNFPDNSWAILRKLKTELDELIDLIELKLSAPVSGSGFLLPRHLM